MEWVDPRWRYKDLIMSKASIVDIINEYKFNLEYRESNQFSHRMKCPFHKKDGAMEKTPSFFVSSATNSFYCFGCGEVGTVIDFVKLVDNVPIIIAINKLAKKYGLLNKDGYLDDLCFQNSENIITITETIEPYLYQISDCIRNHINKFVGQECFNEELIWVEKVTAKIDELLFDVEYNNCEYVKNILIIVKNKIEKRCR